MSSLGLSNGDLIIKVFMAVFPNTKISVEPTCNYDETNIHISKLLPNGRNFCLTKTVSDHTLLRDNSIEFLSAMARSVCKEFKLALGEEVLNQEFRVEKNREFFMGEAFDFPIQIPVMVPLKAMNPDQPLDMGVAGSW